MSHDTRAFSYLRTHTEYIHTHIYMYIIYLYMYIYISTYKFIHLSAGVILETPELFIKAYFTHKPMYEYLPLFISSWIMPEHWDSDLFCFGDARICRMFPPFLRFV